LCSSSSCAVRAAGGCEMLNVVRHPPDLNSETWQCSMAARPSATAAHCRISAMTCCATIVKYDFIGLLGAANRACTRGTYDWSPTKGKCTEYERNGSKAARAPSRPLSAAPGRQDTQSAPRCCGIEKGTRAAAREPLRTSPKIEARCCASRALTTRQKPSG
jgi:hypothetical protein